MLVQSIPYPAASGGGAGPSSTKWRLNITARQTPTNFTSIREVEMFSAVGGADLCTGGTASASTNSATAGNAFDNSGATKWADNGAALPQWLEYDFGSAVSVEAVSITNDTNVGDSPTAFDVQYWNGSTWVTYWSIPADFNTWRVAGAKRVYARRDVAGPGHFRWRINVTLAAASFGNPATKEVQFRTELGGPDRTNLFNTAPYGFAFGSGSQNPWNAFDDDMSTQFAGGKPGQIGFCFTEKKQVVQVAISSAASNNDHYKDFTIEYYDEATSTWVVVKTVTGETGWTIGETRIYTI